MKTRSYRTNRKVKTNSQEIEIKKLQEKLNFVDLINDLNAESINKVIETNSKLVAHIKEMKASSEQQIHQDNWDKKRKNDSLDSFLYASPQLSGKIVLPGEPIKIEMINTNTKIQFNFNGLSEQEVFETVNNVMNSAIDQLINLKKEKTHAEALREMTETADLIKKEKDRTKRRINSILVELTHDELMKRMQNSPVK